MWLFFDPEDKEYHILRSLFQPRKATYVLTNFHMIKDLLQQPLQYDIGRKELNV